MTGKSESSLSSWKGLVPIFKKAIIVHQQMSVSNGSKTYSTPRFVKFISLEDTVYFPVKCRDY